MSHQITEQLMGQSHVLTPSAFQKMSFTTKQRLASTWEMNLPQIVQLLDRSETFHHKVSTADSDQTLFDVFPSEVVFQNYVPHKVCEMPLVLRNRDMSGTSHIPFSPEQNKDYLHQLLCITNRGKFIVPIQAVVLGFPAQLEFSVCPVKHSTQKTLLVCNLGTCTGNMRNLGPFSVIPAVGTLDTDDTIQMTVEFLPLQTRDCSTPLVVPCGTGSATGCACRKMPRRIIFWSGVDTTRGERLSLLSHIFQNERTKVQGDPMLFFDDIFTIKPVILFNKGPIEAHPFSLIPPTTSVGSCSTFLPQLGIIPPDGLQAISISFRTTIPGEFKEEFQFCVPQAPKPVTLTIRGCVIGPTLHFDVPALPLGDTSFGFPRTLSCRLTNTSLMPMAFTLRIPEDGSGQPSLTSSDQTSSNTHPSWRKGAQGLTEPMEFTITPCRGTICSQAFQDIQAGSCSRWRAEPSKGVIPPESEVSVTVTANLDDTGKSEDKVKLFIENSPVNIIPVQAVGIGTTTVTDKPFPQELNFGPHFSWTTEGFSILQQRRALGTTKGKDTPQIPEPVSPVFKLEPPQMELVPGQTKDMVLEGFSSTPQVHIFTT
ncbi:LOW QUALITY PROTEIN: hydrocephalus-inducing protein homolog [Neopelma chrysocephalum]|uniref:LOW QUALITY PROTEIN: hydrocephalus-inducing protein homolog n=1 Tax=Neopelma chrysocephalum TaxID=114329 RepID=UPI000FCD08B3|nr:LOW QUALITY PROTEIN: hydrocephalus-inducing protein homolog [Neopelma chrysocephalum]